MAKIQVAVLGATGAVGQRFIQLMENHPWFEVAVVTGSDRTVGQNYGKAVRWVVPGDIPAGAAKLTIQPTEPNLDVPVVFSALPSKEAWELEPLFAQAGYVVVSNASSYRMAEDVPLIIPEVNPDHNRLIPRQQARHSYSGYIVASPNCATTSLALPLKILHDAFGVEAALITTMQAISGAGFPGVASMSIYDNVIPYIGGEDEKLEVEPKKLLGKVGENGLELAEIALSAQANRVAVMDGHLASVSVRLLRPGTVQEAVEALLLWQAPAICRDLPSSPAQPLVYRPEEDRPQPRLDRDSGRGMAWSVGKVRQCGVLDLRFMAMTHNTLRGAAGGALQNAELLVAQGYIPQT